MKFKCYTCFHVVDKKPCPICADTYLEQMCEADHFCNCPEEITSGLVHCQKCGQPTCPCGSHDVVQISRVTGYLADVSGFNRGKRQELKDRHRYDPKNLG